MLINQINSSCLALSCVISQPDGTVHPVVGHRPFVNALDGFKPSTDGFRGQFPGLSERLTPVSGIEPCLGSAQARRVVDKVLGCPHSSDDAADTFLVADPVVLKAFWSGGDFGRSHAIQSC